MNDVATHPVNPSHERVASGGVRFNVQTVEPPKAEQATFQRSTKPLERVKNLADKFYNGDGYNRSKVPMRIEVSSLQSATHPALLGSKYKPEGSIGSLYAAVMLAYNDHYPLVIRPDDLWVLISFAVAKHIDQNAEALREKYVQHKGKKVLEVRIDHFSMGQMAPEDWERDVFPNFSSQIKQHIGAPAHSAFAASFTTSTAGDRACHEITLMAAMKNYFSYKVRTCVSVTFF